MPREGKVGAMQTRPEVKSRPPPVSSSGGGAERRAGGPGSGGDFPGGECQKIHELHRDRSRSQIFAGEAT